MKQIKIAICGKANSGKNVTANLITDILCKNKDEYEIMAFADSMKHIVLQMFPSADPECLFGSSSLRSKTMSYVKGDKPLTYRQILIELGAWGRSFDPNMWVNVFDHNLNKIKDKRKVIVISDVRFKEELNYLKKNNFIIIKILRENSSHIRDVSETSQDEIPLKEFEFIIDNNGSLDDLKQNIKNILKSII